MCMHLCVRVFVRDVCVIAFVFVFVCVSVCASECVGVYVFVCITVCICVTVCASEHQNSDSDPVMLYLVLTEFLDRKSVGQGKRVDLGGRRIMIKNSIR